MNRNLFSNLIYCAKRGHIYDPDNKKYNCFLPAEDGAYGILDCWVYDESGNIHPGYNVSPVPVCQDDIGKRVNIILREE